MANFREAFCLGGLFSCGLFPGGFMSGWHISGWLFSGWLLLGGLFPRPVFLHYLIEPLYVRLIIDGLRTCLADSQSHRVYFLADLCKKSVLMIVLWLLL